MQLDECSKKIDEPWDQKFRDLGQGRRSRCGEWRVRSVSPFERTDGCSDGGEEGSTAAFDHLMSERRNVTGYIKGLVDQRDELKQEIRAKTAGPVLQSLKEIFEVVRLVPLQEQNLITSLRWACQLHHERRCS